MLKPAAWHPWVTRILASAVGLILVAASLIKAVDMELFISQIKGYSIISNQTVLMLSAWGLISFEFALGIALLIFYRPKFTLAFAGILFMIFLGATTWAIFTGTAQECGCFGDLVKHTPMETIVHDLIFLAATVLAWLGSFHKKQPKNSVKTLTVVAACVIGLLLPVSFGFSASKISHTQLETVETGLKKLETDEINTVDLQKGEHVIVLIDTECISCQEKIPQIDILTLANNLPSVTVFCSNEQEQLLAFIENFQPLFSLEHINEKVFFRLLGSADLPRTILIRNGQVLHLWDHKIPDQSMIKAQLK